MKSIVILFLIVLALPLSADEPVGYVDNSEIVVEEVEVECADPPPATKTVTLPVYHDATGRDCWNQLEWRYYNSAPDFLKGMMREMFNAKFPPIHPPLCTWHQKVVNKCNECTGVVYCKEHYHKLMECDLCGQYQPNTSRHIQAIYQAWVAPEKVTVPLIPGPRGRAGRDGRDGRDGAPGPMGPQGPQGPATLVIVGAQQPMMAVTNGPAPYSQVWTTAPPTSGWGFGWAGDTEFKQVTKVYAQGGSSFNHNYNDNWNGNINDLDNDININK